MASKNGYDLVIYLFAPSVPVHAPNLNSGQDFSGDDPEINQLRFADFGRSDRPPDQNCGVSRRIKGRMSCGNLVLGMNSSAPAVNAAVR